MSVDSDLKKDGIVVKHMLSINTTNALADFVSDKISKAYSSYGFDKETLYNKVSNIPMYIANIPEGFSEASYFYKNSSIYFKENLSLDEMKKFAIHECIHYIQEVRDEKYNLYKLGLYDFATNLGHALNEGAVQLLSSKILEEKEDTVTYYGITLPTKSINIYPIICNLVNQMSKITGEDILVDSTINGNDNFKNKFIENTSKKAYKKIVSNIEKLLDIEEQIILDENKLLSDDKLDENIEKSEKLIAKIQKNKDLIKKLFFETQESIIKNYFENKFNTLTDEIEEFRKELYDFKELIGTHDTYSFYNDFYIQMMEKLDNKFESIASSTYLVPENSNIISKVIKYLRKIFNLNKQTQIDLNDNNAENN